MELNNEQSREYTKKEITDNLMEALYETINYWKTVPNPYIDRMEGCVFSVLSLLDGSRAEFPKFIVAPDPHPEDKQYHIDNEENYFPENYQLDIKCDLSGTLHDLFTAYKYKGDE